MREDQRVPTISSPSGRWTLHGGVVLTVLVVIWFYLWTVQSTAATVRLTGQRNDYYNLLVDGFLDGHLYMKDTPDPQLLALPPQLRPGGAPFKLDASLYEGRYYLYFGVTPVVVLSLPYALLTGNDFPEALAAVVFMGWGFIIATTWWLGIRRQYFPHLGVGWTVLGVIAIGFCTAAPSALRRPLFYEVAIGAGYAFSMLSLWAITKAWQRPLQRCWWLALAGVATGLAIGSRANLAPAGILLLCVGALGVVRKWNSAGRRSAFITLISVTAGAGAVGVGLGGYNYARFGSVTEFGHHYQLGLNPKQMFRVENLGHNLGLYYLNPPVFSSYFPFVSPRDERSKPSDYVGREQVHGEWLWTLVVCVAVVGMTTVWARARERVRSGGLLVFALPAVIFGVNVVVVGLTGVRSNRYMLDFHPGLVLLTLSALGFALVSLRRWRLAVFGTVVTILLPVTFVFNVMASFQSHLFFEQTTPLVYAHLSRVADRLAWPWLRVFEDSIGDREVSFYWPAKGSLGGRQPLVSAGTTEFRDTVILDYDGRGKVRVVYRHGEYGELEGEWFAYEASKRAMIRLSGALLLPRATHPWYRGRSMEESNAMKRRFRMEVDGLLRFDRDVSSFDASPRLQDWDVDPRNEGGGRLISGWVESVTSINPDDSWIRARANSMGAIRLRLMLPHNRFGWAEPLLQSGELGSFDSLAVHYVRPGVIRLLQDQLGSGGRWSEEIAVNYDEPQRVELSLPSANDAGVWDTISEEPTNARMLRVRWNGRQIPLLDIPLVPARPLSIMLGLNWHSASGVRIFFSGRMDEFSRLYPVAIAPGETLQSELKNAAAISDERGIWLRLQRADGRTASLLWQKIAETGVTRVGWWEEGKKTTWLAWLEPSEIPSLKARIHMPPAHHENVGNLSWLELESPKQGVFLRRTEFLNGTAIKAWGAHAANWATEVFESPQGKSGFEVSLPGRLKVRFTLPAGGLSGSDPLLSVGKAGAADSIFLRGLGSGKYIIGLDHWGLGSIESAPIALAADQVHTLVIELGSLRLDENFPKDRVRLLLNEQVVLDATQPLYRVDPSEVIYGANPLGMSTSGPTFRGEIISVLTKARANAIRDGIKR